MPVDQKKVVIKSSLSFKIIGVVVLISLIFLIPLAYLNIEKYKDNLEVAYIEKARTIARLLDANIRSTEELRDKHRLYENIQKNIWLDPDIINRHYGKLIYVFFSFNGLEYLSLSFP